MHRSELPKKTLSPEIIITPEDAGFTFTAATLCSLAVALVFSGVIYAIAAAKGLTAAEYSESLRNNFLYYVFSYGLGSAAIMLAVAAFSVYKKRSYFPAPLAFKKFHPKYAVVGLVMTFGLLFGFTELNNLFVSALSKLGYSKPDMTIPNDEWWQLLIWLALAAAMPAFFEEILFRGYVLQGIKNISMPFAVIAGGLLFSLYHQNPQQTPYQFICGAAFFLIAYKSGSIWPGIIMHFVNNATVLISDFFFKEGFSAPVAIVLTVAGVLCFAGALVYLLVFDGRGKTPVQNEKSATNPAKKRFFIYAAVGIAACAFMWITDLITYIGA
ncbi:MAG: CPBP family intramembrane metalloprotease [Clostridia bacterium]|nr:CPBP family intramembrane metalloprotease [Clostridia bacterium]